MLVKMKCPHCGANMEVNDALDTIMCTYCGTKIANLKERIEVTQNVNVSGTVKAVIDRTNEPNLIISYATAVPTVLMVVRIVGTGWQNTYLNGQSQTYHLRAGVHEIILKIGKRNYSRRIVIPKSNAPVRINATYTGRNAEIMIDQPSFEKEYMEVLRTANQNASKGHSPMAIAAFILSLTGVGSIVGVILATIDLLRGKKYDKNHKHSFAVAALIIGIVMVLYLVVYIIAESKGYKMN